MGLKKFEIPKVSQIFIYRTRANITRGSYTFYHIFKAKNVFFVNFWPYAGYARAFEARSIEQTAPADPNS